MAIEINVIELSEALALREVTRIYGEEALYKNHYEEFRGLVNSATIEITYNKVYNKYYDTIMGLIKKKDDEI